MYERFLQTPHLPAGAVLKHLLKRKGLSQHELALQIELTPQRINDIIAGRRRISASMALKIGKVLSLSPLGLLYILQCNHDLYLANSDSMLSPDITKIRKSFFWDTDLSKMDWQQNAYSVVKRIFEYGDELAIKEIIHFYGTEKVRALLASITDFRLAERRQVRINQYLS
ncbi:MAG: helix-turn-helix domain-containing protein [Muribaculaceae bacterium]|nr:helix-turn-helix domain-containing protein [Muribaculaceae bacterium]